MDTQVLARLAEVVSRYATITVLMLLMVAFVFFYVAMAMVLL